MRASISATPALVAGRTLLSLLAAALAIALLQRSRAVERQAVQELRSQEQLLQTVLNALPDGITLCETVAAPGADHPHDFRLRLVNPAAKTASGHPDAIMGRYMSELFPDSVASGRLAQYLQVMATGEVWETEVFVEAQQQWYRLAAAHAGQYLLLLSTDVTARKEQELAALDYQQRRYEAVFNQTDQGMCLLDAEGRFLDVNRTVLRLGGGTPQDYVGRYLGDSQAWTLPGVAAQLRHAIARAAQGENVREEFSLRRGENQVTHTDVSITPVRGEDDSILFLLVEARDITEQVRARQALQASHAALHELSQTLEKRVRERTALLEASQRRVTQLLETIPNMAWTSQPDGTIDYYNQQWADYTGVSAADLLAGGWQHYIHPEDLAHTSAAWRQAIGTGQPLNELRNRWKKVDDGQYRWHLVRAAPLRDAEGTILLWVGSNTDIHQQQLQQQDLERVNADLENFLYSASHDLKTPISNIESLLTALREELDMPPAEAAVPPLLDMMQHSVERFKRVLTDMTDVLRIEKDHDQPVAEVHLATLIEDVCADLRPLLASTGGRLTVDVAACPVLPFAEKNLRSILLNLLSNAFKYRAPRREPEVRLRAHTTDNYYVLSVEDNGLGLTAAQQRKLFGLFRRMHDHVEGTGIGPYIVKKNPY